MMQQQEQILPVSSALTTSQQDFGGAFQMVFSAAPVCVAFPFVSSARLGFGYVTTQTHGS